MTLDSFKGSVTIPITGFRIGTADDIIVETRWIATKYLLPHLDEFGSSFEPHLIIVRLEDNTITIPPTTYYFDEAESQWIEIGTHENKDTYKLNEVLFWAKLPLPSPDTLAK